MFRLCSPDLRLSIGFVFPIAVALVLAGCDSEGASRVTAQDARDSAQEAKVEASDAHSAASALSDRVDKLEQKNADLEARLSSVDDARVELARKHNLLNNEVSEIAERLRM